MEVGTHKFKTMMIPFTRYQKTYWKAVPAKKIVLFPRKSAAVAVCPLRAGVIGAPD